MAFEITEGVTVRRDERNHVRQLEHSQEPYSLSPTPGVPPLSAPLEEPLKPLADAYLRDVAGLFELRNTELESLDAKPVTSPVPRERELRFDEEKRQGGAGVVSYDQTQFGLPVYESGVSVVIDTSKMAVIGSNNQIDYDINLSQPEMQSEFVAERLDVAIARRVLALKPKTSMEINGKSQLIYRYLEAERLDPQAHENANESTGFAGVESQPFPTLSLPLVHPSIREGQAYVVTEVLFTAPDDFSGFSMNWRTFIEIVTGSVLLLRPLVACAKGMHFDSDPATKSGQPLSASSPAAILDAERTAVTLQDLKPPVVQQALVGAHIALQDIEAPNIAMPTEGAPFDFTYSASTNDFASVCAYHNCQTAYKFVQGIGLDIATYFGGTTFPVPVDPHALNGQINAQARGNRAGNGMGAFVFGRASTSGDFGIAADARVVWHEFGHALLWDHVGNANFGFAHSAGDTLGALEYDPDSKLRKTPDRFESFPFMKYSVGSSRRHDRSVAAGWAWGGSRDDTRYGSEQILSTTLFRIYRLAGGDDEAHLAERKWAARYLKAVIIKAIGLLSRTTRDPRVYVDSLIQADQTHGVFEGHPGGALRKIFRWSFEQQGLYQPPGPPLAVTSVGSPPDVDIFIQNGAQPGGTYEPFLRDFRGTPAIVNRLAADGGTISQPLARGKPNFLYVTVGNRGTKSATGIRLQGFKQKVLSPKVWPTDWKPLNTASLAGPGNLAQGKTVVIGPFQWIPQSDTEQLLFAAEAAGDSSNITTVTAGHILNQRLVRLDNNLAQIKVGPSRVIS